MGADSEFARMLKVEHNAEAQRWRDYDREARRCAGVAWSGLTPDPPPRRPAVRMASDATARLAALRQWRASAPGRLLAAAAEAERAVETLRACVARGLELDVDRCARALAGLNAAAQAAMDAAAGTPLTASPCATNIASSNPSTASSTNSAS
jgi:hypothetical protein